MSNRFRAAFSAFLLLAAGQLVAQSYESEKTEYYYNLKSMKSPSAPRIIKLVNIDNLSTGKQTIQRGILFTCRNRNAGRVLIAGTFSQWKPRAMRRSNYGIWYYFAPAPKAVQEVAYKYIVDGVWLTDSSNPFKRDDNAGSYVSLTSFPREIHSNDVTYRILPGKNVEFRLYRPRARMVAVVGDFNNWNPENDILKRRSNGIWHITRQLPPGKYRYQYIVDGKWTYDLFNKNSGSNDTGDLCSVLMVPR